MTTTIYYEGFNLTIKYKKHFADNESKVFFILILS